MRLLLAHISLMPTISNYDKFTNSKHIVTTKILIIYNSYDVNVILPNKTLVRIKEEN